MEIFSALRNCRSVSRVGSTCLPAPQRCETTCYSVCHMYVKSCNCKPCNSAFLLWVRMACSEGDHHVSPCFPPLGLVATLFTHPWINMSTSYIFESMVWGERLVRCFSIVEAWTVSGSVSVRTIIFLSTWVARAYLFPLDTPTYIPPPLVTWWACPLLSRPALHPGEQLWMGMPKLPLWVGQVLTRTQ